MLCARRFRRLGGGERTAVDSCGAMIARVRRRPVHHGRAPDHAMHKFVQRTIRQPRGHRPDDSTSAQIAIMPMNRAIDTSAAASSATTRSMSPSCEHIGNIVHVMFLRQELKLGLAATYGAPNARLRARAIR